MYANAPHASTTPLSSPSTQQHQSAGSGQVLEHGHPQGMPPAAPGGHHGSQAVTSTTFAPTSVAATLTTMTGAYQPSGDPSIDRMLRLEAACKRFGSLI